MRALLETLIVSILVISALSVPRAIPSTDENAEYFETVQKIITDGERTTSPQCPSGSALQQLVDCVVKCNAAGPVLRDNCCCVTSVSEGSPGAAHFGLAGGCRYPQTLRNFTDGDRFDYDSFPIDPSDSAQLYFDPNTCESVEEGTAVGDSCQCSISWTIARSELNDVSPLPTPSASATPERSATPTVTPTPSPVFNSPSSSPSVQESQSPQTSSSTSPSAMMSPATSVPPPPVPIGSPTPSVSDVGGSGLEADESDELEPEDDDAISTPDGGPGGAENEDDADDADDADDEGSNVCVDERYLVGRGFKAEHLVHKISFTSPVWCPSHADLPCATSNHKIRLNGVSISYRQMCEEQLLSCRRDVAKVNSVWTHIWEEVTHGNTVLTMYDVRYSESAQRLLHRVMHSIRIVVRRQ